MSVWTSIPEYIKGLIWGQRLANDARENSDFNRQTFSKWHVADTAADGNDATQGLHKNLRARKDDGTNVLYPTRINDAHCVTWYDSWILLAGGAAQKITLIDDTIDWRERLIFVMGLHYSYDAIDAASTLPGGADDDKVSSVSGITGALAPQNYAAYWPTAQEPTAINACFYSNSGGNSTFPANDNALAFAHTPLDILSYLRVDSADGHLFYMEKNLSAVIDLYSAFWINIYAGAKLF